MSSDNPTPQSIDILIDADSIYFRNCMASQKEKDIRLNTIAKMKEIERECGIFSEEINIRVAVKGKGNFRHELYSEYKANRKELEPDIRRALAYGHQFMVDRYDAVMADDMEADDLVSIWAYECMREQKPYVIVGIDKDLLQIPGAHYNFVKKEHQYVDPDTGHLKLMLQCLTGDTADNIPGIRGVGPKKAEAILRNVPTDKRWDVVVDAWKRANAGDPELSYKLLRMLTSWEDYEEIRTQIQGQTSECEQDVRSEGEENLQDSGVCSVSERDTGSTDVGSGE